ncbi:MAG TPA: DUF885 domain-containing protein [Allosphingosinicella sp.]|nr:DUF885 domain-containing protein [Allosphingosinicella sp.]
MRLAAALLALVLAAPVAAQEQESVEAGAGFGAAGLENCRTDLRYLNQLFGWQMSWQREWQTLANAPDDELRAAIMRWRTAPAALDRDVAALRAASERGPGAAPRVIAERVLAEVEDLAIMLRRGAPPLRADADPALRRAWEQLVSAEIAPAVERYRDFLKDLYVPAASASAGLSGTPDGPRCFRQAVRVFTTIDRPPEEIERIGWRLLRESEGALARLYGIDRRALPRLLARLRDTREAGFTADRLTAMSVAAIARARAAMPRMFSGPARADVVVEPLPTAMEASAAAGFYRRAASGRPVAYVINRARPGERRLMAEAIAFHETLPGHHVTAALGLPDGAFNSGYAEGWALYAEYLADEMGLYSSPLDRAGMIAKHLWAASRLVVEPGLHLRGWTRDRAVRFMRAHTALTDAEIAVEVDRYIATPGQSLSYMLGYDRIAGARRYAERTLGARFDLRRFHDVVLRPGARPLDRVHADVVRWADRGGEGPHSTP